MTILHELATKRSVQALVIGGVIWFLLHVPAILYGTTDIPLHASYVGDEQAPVFGALHILEQRSLLGLRNETALYYGPLWSTILVPAVLGDYILKFVTGEVSGPTAYGNYAVWDWGGIILLARVAMVLMGLLGLVGVYILFRTRTLNPSASTWLPYTATVFLAFQFMYFDLAGFARHWLPVTVIAIWQLYLMVRLYEATSRRARLWVLLLLLSVLSFGISYVPLLYQVALVPVLVQWFRQQDWQRLQGFGYYLGGLFILCGAIVAWHPYAFFRLLGLAGLTHTTDPLGPLLDLTSTATTSFLAYGELILLTNPTMFVAVGMGLGVLLQRRYLRSSWPLLLLLALPAVAHYLVLSVPAEYVARYMLPTITFAILFAFAVLALLVSHIGERHWISRTYIGCLVIAFGVNLFFTTGMIFRYIDRPVEQVVIEQVQAWQRAQPSARTLFVNAPLLPYAHTRQAYESYLGEEERTYSLWQHILSAEPPDDVQPVHAFYVRGTMLPPEDVLEEYEHVIVREAQGIVGRYPHYSDVFYFKPWIAWQHDAHTYSYSVLK